MNKIILEEIMKLPQTEEFGLMCSISILSKYGTVDILQDDKHNLYYQIKVSDILLSDITAEDLMNVRNSGWELSDDKKCLIKKI